MLAQSEHVTEKQHPTQPSLSAHYFDSLVILADTNASLDTDTELANLAEQFSRILPVVIVTPCLESDDPAFTKTAVENIYQLQVSKGHNTTQTHSINEQLANKQLINPILWVNNPSFANFVLRHHSKCKILQTGSTNNDDAEQLLQEHVDAVVSDNLKRSHNGYIHFVENILKKMSFIKDGIKNKTLPKSYNVLMLYDDKSTHVQTIVEHLKSFERYSKHRYNYLPASSEHDCDVDLSFYNAIAVHFSLRVCFDGHLSPHFEKALRQYGGLKILYIQDDYNLTETARRRIKDLGFHLVFTFVPDKFVDTIYSKNRFPQTLFKNVLTGFIPENLLRQEFQTPIAQRPYTFVYRGRTLPFSYGTLCYEKYYIGKEMKRLCQERDIPADIEVDDARRIYGDDWYRFIASGRATLGTETGTNLFDFDGSISDSLNKLQSENPNLRFEDVYDEWIKPNENLVDIHELSPKIFEAVCLRTALVLFEGEYSGILKPNVHYIPLKKDFSNLDEVLTLLDDLPFLEKLTQRAYEDIVGSGKYTYQTFIEEMDRYIDQALGRSFIFKPQLTLNGFEIPKPLSGTIDSPLLTVPATDIYTKHKRYSRIQPDPFEKLKHQVDSLSSELQSARHTCDTQKGKIAELEMVNIQQKTQLDALIYLVNRPLHKQLIRLANFLARIKNKLV
jgi:hypothetical protein